MQSKTFARIAIFLLLVGVASSTWRYVLLNEHVAGFLDPGTMTESAEWLRHPANRDSQDFQLIAALHTQNTSRGIALAHLRPRLLELPAFLSFLAAITLLPSAFSRATDQRSRESRR